MRAIEVILAGWGMALAGRGLGEWVLRPFRVADAPRLSRALWATGLGLGAIALATLGVGTLGHPRWGLGVCLLGLLLGAPAIVADLAAARGASRTWRWTVFQGALLAACLVAFAASVVLALLPQWDYDVLEYHLGAPMQYLRLGRIEHLPWNVYASFPENAEMLFLSLLALFGSAMEGGMASGALNVAVGALCALAVADLARTLFGPKAAVPAAALFACYPMTWSLSGACFVEVHQTLFSVLCVRALVGEGGRRTLLAGVFAGLAMGTKYPAALFLAVPVGLFVLGVRGFRPAAAFGIAALLVVSPWLVKNAIATGDPVYPIFGRALHATGWTADREARFSQAHHPPMPAAPQAATALWEAISGQHRDEEGELTVDPPQVAIVVLLAPFLVFLPCEGTSRRRALALLALAAFHVATWWLWTNRIHRFFFPCVAWLAVLGGVGLVSLSNEFLRNLAKTASALLLAFHAAWSFRPLLTGESVIEQVRGERDSWEFLFDVDRTAFEPFLYVNAHLPRDARVMVIGEVRTFYLERDFVAATVFDGCPLDAVFPEPPKDDEAAREAFRRAGVTHVLVNWSEVRRLRETYSYTIGGDRRPGYSEVAAPAVFRALERGTIEKVQGFGHVVPALGGEVVVLYRVTP